MWHVHDSSLIQHYLHYSQPSAAIHLDVLQVLVICLNLMLLPSSGLLPFGTILYLLSLNANLKPKSAPMIGDRAFVAELTVNTVRTVRCSEHLNAYVGALPDTRNRLHGIWYRITGTGTEYQVPAASYLLPGTLYINICSESLSQVVHVQICEHITSHHIFTCLEYIHSISAFSGTIAMFSGGGSGSVGTAEAQLRGAIHS
jgi:hypothetical protein